MIKLKFCIIITIIFFLGPISGLFSDIQICPNVWLIQTLHIGFRRQFLSHFKVRFYSLENLLFVFQRISSFMSLFIAAQGLLIKSQNPTVRSCSAPLLYGIWKELWRKFRLISFSHWGLWTPVRHTKKRDFRDLVSSTADLPFPSWNLCLWDDLIVVPSLGSQQASSITITITFDWHACLLPAGVYKNSEMWPISPSNKL